LHGIFGRGRGEFGNRVNKHSVLRHYKPKQFNFLYYKDYFLRVERYTKLLASFQNSPEVRQVIFLDFREDGDIVKIDNE
jgi:hypothetical protein